MHRHFCQVIMEPIEALVVPGTNIICAPGYHPDHPVRQLCDTPQHLPAYDEMMNTGVVADSLLHVLLGEYAARKETIVRWMVRLGLLVPVREATKTLASTADHPYLCDGVPSYIAPTLLLDEREGQ